MEVYANNLFYTLYTTHVNILKYIVVTNITL